MLSISGGLGGSLQQPSNALLSNNELEICKSMERSSKIFLLQGAEKGRHAERQLVECDRGYEQEDQGEQVDHHHHFCISAIFVIIIIITITIIVLVTIINRQELRKFMRETRKSNPAAQCSLQGDKLYIDHKYDK